MPDSVLAVPGGMALVLEEAAGLPVAGIRVSAPLGSRRADDARALVALALERARPFADLVGASIWAGVERGRMAYHVIGDRADLDELAWVARVLANRPLPTGLRQAAERQRTRADRLAETPHGRVVAAVEASRPRSAGPERAASDGPAPNLGDPGYDEEAHFLRIERLWADSHARDRLRVFVLGASAPVPVALSQLSLLGAPPTAQAGLGGRRTRGRVSGASATGQSVGAYASSFAGGSPGRDALSSAGAARSSAAAPPPVSAWAGAFFRLGPPESPRTLIARKALSAGLAELPLPGVALRVEHGLGEGSEWLAVAATALAQRTANAALAEVLALLTEPALRARWSAAAESVHGDLLAAAATPAGWLSLADAHYAREGFLRGALAEVRLAGVAERQAVVADFESSLVRLDRGR